MDYTLPDEYRKYFREPFGPLFQDIIAAKDEFADCMIIAVGDVVTHNLVEAGILPDLAVIDGSTMREPCNREVDLSIPEVGVSNPAGMITGALIRAIGDAMHAGPRLVRVDGEEDLAVIPAIRAAPDGACVLYGQPGEGVVVITVDADARDKADKLFRLFVAV
ncbi:GTP-dependent dephospho-CoA kinase family protein [Methanogenium organophilum]|uniref:GTP-dependent dephospho-CoA kinase n=1 Tax=Methanogenium organophilum TaxID=2199 RepID=A0A9X9S3N7_METOG|nr:GTP-dependent dephospho-CoA kinase family protein [Methanogenium organophilum]WAI00320.1 GTP-dependent dephospho-CoA kinase family protein [Methanogenium organophilum]